MLSRMILTNQIYFVTTKTSQNSKIFKDDKNCQLFINTLKSYRKFFELYGFVILPDHIHLLIKPQEVTISKLMNYIKGKSARLINLSYVVERSRSDETAEPKGSATRGKFYPRRTIWQKSFYDHAIRNDQDFIEKLNYIHKNPLKHNITNNLDLYFWSSYHNYYPQFSTKIKPLIEIDKINL